MNIPKINIELVNKNKYNAVSLYPLVQEIYEKYVFLIHSEETMNKLKNEIYLAVRQHYPKIISIDGVNFQTNGQEMTLYFSEKFLSEMEHFYPEALI